MQIPEPTTIPPADASISAAPPPRRLPAADGIGWWGESWRIFCAAPLVWVGMFVLFAMISVALVLVPVVGSLVHTVLTPVFAGGAMLGCHALARGEPLRLSHLFDGFQQGRLAPLCVLGLIWLALVFVMAIVMVATIFLALGATGLAAIMDFGSAGLDYTAFASAGVSVLVVALIALGLMLLAAMAYWFAPALVVLNGETPVAALQKSFAASMHNVGAFLLYGIAYIGLAIVASIPLGLGWLVLGPMIVGSCYAGWRTIFSR